MDPETSPLTDLERSTAIPGPFIPLANLLYSIFFQGQTEYFREKFYDDDKLWEKYETEGMSVTGVKIKTDDDSDAIYTIVEYQIDGIQQRRRLSMCRKDGRSVDVNGEDGGKKEQSLESRGVLYYTKIKNCSEEDSEENAMRRSRLMATGGDLSQFESQQTNISINNNSDDNDDEEKVDLIILPLYPNSAVLRSIVTSRPEKQPIRFVDRFFGFAHYSGFSWLFVFLRTMGYNAVIASLAVLSTSKKVVHIIPTMVWLILIEFIISYCLFARRWRNNHLRAVLYSAVTATTINNENGTDNIVIAESDDTKSASNAPNRTGIVAEGDDTKDTSNAPNPVDTYAIEEHQHETYENFVGEDEPSISQFLCNDMPYHLSTIVQDLFYLILWTFFLLPFLLAFGPAMYIVRHTSASEWRLKLLRQYTNTAHTEGEDVTEIVGTIRKKHGKFIYLSYECDQVMYNKRIDVYEMFNGGCLLDSSEKVGRLTRLVVLPSNPTSAILTSIVEQRDELEMIYNRHHWPFAKALITFQIVCICVLLVIAVGGNQDRQKIRILMVVLIAFQLPMGFLGAAIDYYLFFWLRLRYDAEPLLGRVRDRVREPEMSREVTNMAIPLMVTVSSASVS